MVTYGVYSSDKLEYAHWHSIINSVTLFIGCAILWEMRARMWLPFQTLRRAARICQAALGVLIAALAVRFAMIELRTPLDNPAFRLLERDCRACQAVFFVAIVSAVFYYGIPVGRTLKAVCLGDGLYVAVSLIALTVWSYEGTVGSTTCAYLPTASFDAATIIWLVGLWKPGEPLSTAWSTGQGSKSGERPPYSTVRSATAIRQWGPKAARA